MLECLPEHLRELYSKEENIVVAQQRSQVIFEELQVTYGFVGGSYQEYIKYFARQDYDTTMWHWADVSDVRAIAGMSAVPKSDPQKQRKLLMQCAANYFWRSVDERADLGMTAGGALATAHSSTGEAYLAAWDQSTAFTSVVTPSWMWKWTTAPPVRAKDVWSQLSASLRKNWD